MVERDGQSSSSSTPRASSKLKTAAQAACPRRTWSRSSSSTSSRIRTGCSGSRPARPTSIPSFQRDKYGTFLSGHTPIYDSQGRYSGFVGVDFDSQYYLAQEASFRAISIGTLAGAVLIALLIGYLAARYHFDVHDRIEEQYRISIRDELTQLLNRRGALTVLTRGAGGARVELRRDPRRRRRSQRHQRQPRPRGRRRVPGQGRGGDSRQRARERHLRALRRRRVPDLRRGLRSGRGDRNRAAHSRQGVFGRRRTRSRSHFGVSIGICVAPARRRLRSVISPRRRGAVQGEGGGPQSLRDLRSGRGGAL